MSALGQKRTCAAQKECRFTSENVKYWHRPKFVVDALLGLLISDPVPASVAREPRQTGCALGFQIENHQSLLSLGEQYRQPSSGLLHARKRESGDRESRSANAWPCLLCAQAANLSKDMRRQWDVR